MVKVTFPNEALPYAIASLRVELAWQLGAYEGTDVNLLIQRYDLSADHSSPTRSFILTVPTYIAPIDYLHGVLGVLAVEGECGEFDYTVLGL